MASKKRHNIYVVEHRFVRENPGCDPEKPCYYVGMTGLSPEERFENHRNGYKSNRFVERYGLRLCPRLYDEHNPLSYDDAREMEVELARMLREKGHGVWQK